MGALPESAPIPYGGKAATSSFYASNRGRGSSRRTSSSFDLGPRRMAGHDRNSNKPRAGTGMDVPGSRDRRVAADRVDVADSDRAFEGGMVDFPMDSTGVGSPPRIGGERTVGGEIDDIRRSGGGIAASPGPTLRSNLCPFIGWRWHAGGHKLPSRPFSACVAFRSVLFGSAAAWRGAHPADLRPVVVGFRSNRRCQAGPHRDNEPSRDTERVLS